MNRVQSGRFGDTPCQVIQQKNVFYDKIVCQFSWYCENPTTKRYKDPKVYAESLEAAKMVYMEGFRLPGLQDALYYHADYVNPQWGKPRVAKIGRHIFYKERT
jgi:spore germination cell wall hydrolase CwlJ-like protein